MKRIILFLLAFLLCFLVGCGQTNTQETKSSKENINFWVTNSISEGSGSIELEDYALQHIAYLESEEYQEVLSVNADLVGQASLAYKESLQAKINNMWTTLSKVSMVVGEDQFDLTNEL